MNCKHDDNKFISDGNGSRSEKCNTKKGTPQMKKQTTMIDSNGVEVPLKYIQSYDRQRDCVVRRIHARFLRARKLLENLVADSIADLDKLSQLKETLGDKGNYSAQSFDGLLRASIRQRYNIALDERVIKARELMLGYVNRVLSKIGESESKALRLIVSEAFRANSHGILSTNRIFALLRMEINDPDWHQAKEILQDSIKPQKGKRYLSCETRKSTQKDFEMIRLDIADCWPDETSTTETDQTNG